MFKVKKECCNECLFSKNKIVSDSRKASILKGCVRDDAHFICHKATIDGEDICCSGFYKSYSTNMIRISQRLRMVKLVD
jgi:hypothetical protein